MRGRRAHGGCAHSPPRRRALLAGVAGELDTSRRIAPPQRDHLVPALGRSAALPRRAERGHSARPHSPARARLRRRGKTLGDATASPLGDPTRPPCGDRYRLHPAGPPFPRARPGGTRQRGRLWRRLAVLRCAERRRVAARGCRRALHFVRGQSQAAQESRGGGGSARPAEDRVPLADPRGGRRTVSGMARGDGARRIARRRRGHRRFALCDRRATCRAVQRRRMSAVSFPLRRVRPSGARGDGLRCAGGRLERHIDSRGGARRRTACQPG